MEEPLNINKEEINLLIKYTDQHKNQPVVTMYLPTHRSTDSASLSEDQIRCKNLYNKVIQLIKANNNKELLSSVTNSFKAIFDSRQFWENQTEGLLICISPDFAKFFHLSIEPHEYFAIDNNFHLTAAMSLLSIEMKFYILDVAQHQPTLFSVEQFNVSKSGIELPESLESYLNIDEGDHREEQQRSASFSGFNGRGGFKDSSENDRHLFWKAIDEIINKKVKKGQLLILAGTEKEIKEYQAITKYKKISDYFINGRITDLSSKDLSAKLKNIWQEIFQIQMAHEIKNEFLNSQSSRAALNNEKQILEAGQSNRIAKLLVNMMKYTADTVENNLNKEPVITFWNEDQETEKQFRTKLEEIAILTWRNGGQIINLDHESMPITNSRVLAILRY